MKITLRNSSVSLSSIGLITGPAAAGLLLLIGAPNELQVDGSHLSPAWVTLSLLALMAIWWVTEAIPIPVTSLLPIIVLPLFGINTVAQVSAPYMHPIVVLLMGGFIFAKAIEVWGLHERIALHAVRLAGGSPAGMIGGFMFAAAILSMWISNSATSIMMMPIALSVAAAYAKSLPNQAKHFTYALLLGIAYACSIGGLGTPIGTPTNLIILGYLNDQGNVDIGFSQWMMVGIPAVLLLLPIAWLVLTRWVFKMPTVQIADAQAAVHQRLLDLGRMTTPEKRTLTVFVVIAALWAFRRSLNEFTFSYAGVPFTPFAGLTDHMTAVFAVLLCFIVPAGCSQDKRQALLSWQSAEKIPWGVLLLFGGGMSLAQAISSSGLSAYFGSSLSVFASYPIPVIIFFIATLVLALTEVTSNVATAAALMPVLGALAFETGLPLEMLAAPIALAASCAFMLPMATGPNAVVFATGEVSLPTMARSGIRINLIAVIVITMISYYIAPIALG